MNDSLKKRYLIKLFANFINGVINMAIIAIVPSALGPIMYGKFIYLQQFFSKFIGLLDSGTSTAFFTKLSKDIKRVELIKFYFFYALTLLSFMILSIYIIDNLNILSYLFPHITIKYIYLGLLFSFLVWFTTLYIYISDAYALTFSVESIKIVHKVISLILLLLFVQYIDFNLTNYYYYNYLILFIFIFFIIIFFIKLKIFNMSIFVSKIDTKSIVKEFFNFASPLVLFNIFSILASLFDIWLLQTMGGSKQVGFYGLAYSISAMCFIFTSSMTPIITREFAKYYAKKNMKKIKELFFRYIPMLYSISAYLGIFIAFQSDNILSIFTNSKFEDANLVIIVMAFYPIHQTYGQLSGSIFYVTEETKLIRTIGLFSTFIGLVLSLILIYLFNLKAVGLAYKMVLIQIISVNIQLYFNSKFLDFKILRFIYHQILSICYFIFFAWISTLIVIFEDNLYQFLLSGLIYTIFVIIGTIIVPIIFGLRRRDINIYLEYMLKKGFRKWR